MNLPPRRTPTEAQDPSAGPAPDETPVPADVGQDPFAEESGVGPAPGEVPVPAEVGQNPFGEDASAGGPWAVPQGAATAAVDGLTVDYAQQAAGSAQSYIDMPGFSRSGLVDQLVYEGYTPDQAESGVSSLSVDCSEQAGRSAQSCLDLMPMSRAELVDQQIYEGYTPDEAAAGADSAGR